VMNIGLGILMMCLPLTQYCQALPQMKEEVDLQPPSIVKSSWSWNGGTHKLSFRLDIEELGEKNTRMTGGRSRRK